jgi:hypothetical protein
LQIALAILAALATAAMAIVAVRTLYQSPIVGAGLVALLVLAEAVLVDMPALKGEISLYPHDLACALFAAAGLLRLLWACRPKAAHFFLFGLCAFFLLSAFRGIDQFGLQTAGNESRGTAYALCAAFYFMTFSYDDLTRNRLINLMLACAYGLAGLAVFRWTALLLNIPVPSNWAEVSGDKAIRVLNASQALIVCQVAMLAWTLQVRRQGIGVQRLLVYLLILIVLILQHRSVWIAGAVAGAWLYFRSGRETRFNWRQIAYITIAGTCAICITMLIAGDTLLNFIQDSIFAAAGDHSTLAWRVAGWDQLLFGQSQLGLGRRVIAGIIWEQAPHSYYIQVLLRMGAVGLLLLIGVYANCMNRLRTNPLLQAWLVSQIVFFIAYSPGMEQGMILGFAVGCVSLAQSSVANESRATTEFSESLRKASIATA